MKIISHRGNIKGKIDSRENKPSYIDSALGCGFEVELDVWFKDGNFWLGHDEPDVQVNENWIRSRKEKIWIHCKNLESALKLSQLKEDFIYFCHTQDPYSLISNKKIWLHDLNLKVNSSTVVPLMEDSQLTAKYSNVYGICTDYPMIASEIYGIKL